MCGICGFAGHGVGQDESRVGERMRDLLAHRGPDDRGGAVVSSPESARVSAWLGHRRLSILDLTPAGHQPMTDASGRVGLVFNGEIYNFRELRAELARRGHPFRSSGDSEVVLAAYLEWGTELVSRIDGMFALAIHDSRSGQIFLARDRSGKKPLYYSWDGGRLTFASEIKSLLVAPWVSRDVAAGRIPEYLVYGYVPTPATPYQSILQLPPGSSLVWTGGAPSTPQEYWDWRAADKSGPPPISAHAAAPEVRALIRAAVKRRMVADVPLGALLSGGIDSSIVVGTMAEFSPEPVHTFSIGFPEQPALDETPYARKIAKRFGTEHTEFAVRVDAVGLLDRLLWHYDMPFADSSAIPTYLVSQLAREHVSVVLTGDGGDEVFGGYERFKAAMMARTVPRPLAALLRAGVGMLPKGDDPRSFVRRGERFLGALTLSVNDRYQSWISFIQPGDALALVRPEVRELMPESIDASMERCYARIGRTAPMMDAILYANFKTYLPDDLSVKVDRTSMAHSLEARSPFLDTAVLDFARRISGKERVGIRHVKPVLREAFWDLLPREIWDRRKQGFGVPMDLWFRGALGTVFKDEVIAADARVNAYLDPSGVKDLWRRHETQEGDEGARLWTLLTLERWLRGLEADPAPSPPPLAISA